MGKNVVVIGTQWGDEGKGKIVDWLDPAPRASSRFQGGHNAGHARRSAEEDRAAADPGILRAPSRRALTGRQRRVLSPAALLAGNPRARGRGVNCASACDLAGARS